MQGDQRTERQPKARKRWVLRVSPEKKGGVMMQAWPKQQERERKFLEEKHPWEKALPWEARGGTAPER